MLKISTKSRYGTRVMINLAEAYGQGYVFLKDIAKKENIPEKYLEKILSILRSKKLVNSARGKKGGYALNKPPEEITVKNIVETLETNFTFSECLNAPGICFKNKSCVTRSIWKNIDLKIKEMMDNMTLEDILKKQKRHKNTSLTY